MICGKCDKHSDLIKRIICKGTSKECFTYYCPNCDDQISPSACRND